MKRVQFNIATGNSQGLINDSIIVKEALERIYGKKIKVRLFSGVKSYFENIFSLMSLLVSRFILFNKQITFHMEALHNEVYFFSSVNILIPNQEWLNSRTQKSIRMNTLIWCKTHYAVQKLQHLNNNVEYLGFCSRDLYDASVQKDLNAYIHVAGKSKLKGTLPILNAWSKHPEWPLLTVISRQKEHVKFKSKNIDVIDNFIGEDELKQLINRIGIHLCPSESEGFGHNIVEALSVGAIVITTDAPPMNEIVSESVGFLVDWDRTDNRYFSDVFYVNEEKLIEEINAQLNLSIEDKELISKNSRIHFLKMKNDFQSEITHKLKVVLSKNRS